MRCGIVLAGGLSRRFGSPKAFARKNGQYYYAITSQLLSSVCDQVIIVSRTEHLHLFPREELVIVDEPHVYGHGPLAGIYSAMKAIRARNYIVLPCDMPNMEKEVLTQLIEEASDTAVTAFTVNGKKQPLVSLWPEAMLEAISEALESKQRRVMDLLERTKTTWIDGSSFTDTEKTAHVFNNMNTPG